MDLAGKRRELIAEHQAAEKYDPHWKAEAAAGDKISERPIAFLCDDEVVVLDECVGKLFYGLKKFADKVDDDSEAWKERAAREPAVAQAIAKTTKFLAGEPPEELRVPQQIWNALALALGEVGFKVVLTQG